ncbi:MAG: bifunctional oligoribonuclease/PAP phosphatase NrnA [bacterium]
MKYKCIENDILSLIRKNASFFITGHIRPDGDCLSAELALALFLRRMGKRVVVANRDPVPSVYDFLPGVKTVKKTGSVKGLFDVGFFLDSSNADRTGGVVDIEKQISVSVTIDHHVDAHEFGDYNYIDPKASSTCELIYRILNSSQKNITSKEAMCLYTGIMTDTGGFQQANTTAEVHSIIADLIQKGVNPCSLGQKVYCSRKPSQMKLIGLALSTLEVDSSGQVLYFDVSNSMYQKAGSAPEETEGIIDFLNYVKGIKVIILFKQTEKKDLVKISLRSRSNINVNTIAKRFGGGGHKKAAGCTVVGKPEAVKKIILKEVRRELKSA